MSVNTFMANKFTVTGGGYFLFFPYRLIKKIVRESNYTMTYFHPRDFDPKQPMLDDLSLKRKFKSYYNLESSYIKFKQLIYDFDFIDMLEAANKIDWNNVPVVGLGSLSK